MSKIINDKPELSKDFPPQSKSQWMDLVSRDLEKSGKGTEALWKYTEEQDFPIICSSEDMGQIGAFTFRRNEDRCRIRMDFSIENPVESNLEIQAALKKGVSAIGLKPETNLEAEDWEKVFEEVSIVSLNIHFLFGSGTIKYWPALKLYLEDKTTDQWQGSFDFDPLLNQKSLGQEDLDWLEEACEILPNFKCINIDQNVFHKKEKHETTELALLLAKASEYFHQLKKMNPELLDKKAQSAFQIIAPVGCDYFVEIAKLRALHLLWPNLVKAYELTETEVYLQARNSPLFTHEDPYWNMLRHTSMAMSAVIGGADIVHLKIQGEKEAENPEFFQRIAINVLHILREESKLENVNDPANGSYYIENLTYQIAEQAWKKFQQIEADGGFAKIEKL